MTLHAQENNLTYTNTPLEEIIKDLESRYDVVFSYTADLLENELVNIEISEDRTLEQVLDEIIGPTDLSYDFHGEKYIVLKPKTLSTFDLCASIYDDQNEPLSFVNIYIPSRQMGTTSEENGEFSWTVALKGNETVELSYIGYEKYVARASDLKDCPRIILR